MKSKYTWFRKHKIVSGILGVFILLMLIGAFSQQEDIKTVDKVNQTPTAAKPIDNKIPQTPTEKLWAAVDTGLKTRDGVDIKYDASQKTGTLIVTRSSDKYLSSKYVIQGAYSNFVAWGKDASNVSELETIVTILRTDFIDAHGKKAVDDAVTISMQTDTYKKFQWKNLEGQVISTNLQNQDSNPLGYLMVHPSLRPELPNARLLLN